jgi:predicted nucleotidyltransferase
MERQQVLRILRANRRELERDFAVKTLALFGSVARGESTARSDVDLLVEFNRPIGLLHLIQTDNTSNRYWVWSVWTSSSAALSCRRLERKSSPRRAMPSSSRRWKFRIEHLLGAAAER